MSYKVSFPGNNAFTGNHMGLTFTHGEAHTNDSFLASRLQNKGYSVTDEAVVDDETVSDQGEVTEGQEGFTPFDLERMSVPQLKEYAKAGGIDLGGARTKAEIVTAIYAANAETEQ